MTTRKPTTRLNLESLEARDIPSRGWDLALGYNDHGEGKVRFAVSATYAFTFPTGDSLYQDSRGVFPSQELRVAVGDVNRDGTPDVVTANGPHSSWRSTPRVDSRAIMRVFDGTTVASGHPRMIAKVALPWLGGGFVACGDLDGDGYAEVVAGRDIADDGFPLPAIANQVAIYSGRTLSNTPSGTSPSPMVVFSGIADSGWHGGTPVAVGDLNGDRKPELVVGTGSGGGPRVAVWDNVGLFGVKTRHTVCGDFFADIDWGRDGVAVAVADVTGDGQGDLVSGTMEMHVYEGERLVAGDFYYSGPELSVGSRSWLCRIAVRDFDGDAKADIAESYPDSGTVRMWHGEVNTPIYPHYEFTLQTSFDPFNGMLDGPNTGGVWVG